MNIEHMTAQERSRRAKDLLDDPFLQHVLSMMEQAYIEAWKNSPRDDWDAREGAYSRLFALTEFRADLKKVATESAINAFNRRSREVI